MRISDWSSDVCSSDLPDFYVVRRGWIEDVLNHMAANRLAIFGAPWHPFWFNKFRGFPCAHFMAIDRSRVAICPEDVIPVLLYDRRLPHAPVLREWARAGGGQPPSRSEERRVGQESVSTWKTRWSPD